MKQHMIVGLVAAGCAFGAFADFEIKLDLSGKPMRDLSKTTSKAIVGYISAMHEYGDDYWFVTNKATQIPRPCAHCSASAWFIARFSSFALAGS